MNSQMLDFSWQNKTVNHSIPRPVMNDMTCSLFELSVLGFISMLFSSSQQGGYLMPY